MMKEIKLRESNNEWNSDLKYGKAYHFKHHKLYDGDAILIKKEDDILVFYGFVGFFSINMDAINNDIELNTIFELE